MSLLLVCFTWAGIVAVGGGAETKSKISENARRPKTETELRYWLQNMVYLHRFSLAEIQTATGMSRKEVEEALEEQGIDLKGKPWRGFGGGLVVVPYPGGRHPRIGFLDGAINPQRETKLSVFPPWDPQSYIVIDVPEAIWSNLGLIYLAHTHVPTYWTQRGVELEPLEWRRRRDGTLSMDRKLPNGVTFSTRALPGVDGVRLELKLVNGSTNHLSDLRVQMCAMLKGMNGFQQQTNANKVFASPFSACKSEDGNRWVIWGWQPAHRAWGNPPVPCLHVDPKFPDCPPGQTRRVRGWLSFYEGDDIKSELSRIEQDPWLLEALTFSEEGVLR